MSATARSSPDLANQASSPRHPEVDAVDLDNFELPVAEPATVAAASAPPAPAAAQDASASSHKHSEALRNAALPECSHVSCTRRISHNSPRCDTCKFEGFHKYHLDPLPDDPFRSFTGVLHEVSEGEYTFRCGFCAEYGEDLTATLSPEHRDAAVAECVARMQCHAPTSSPLPASLSQATVLAPGGTRDAKREVVDVVTAGGSEAPIHSNDVASVMAIVRQQSAEIEALRQQLEDAFVSRQQLEDAFRSHTTAQQPPQQGPWWQSASRAQQSISPQSCAAAHSSPAGVFPPWPDGRYLGQAGSASQAWPGVSHDVPGVHPALGALTQHLPPGPGQPPQPHPPPQQPRLDLQQQQQLQPQHDQHSGPPPPQRACQPQQQIDWHRGHAPLQSQHVGQQQQQMPPPQAGLPYGRPARASQQQQQQQAAWLRPPTITPLASADVAPAPDTHSLAEQLLLQHPALGAPHSTTTPFSAPQHGPSAFGLEGSPSTPAVLDASAPEFARLAPSLRAVDHHLSGTPHPLGRTHVSLVRVKGDLLCYGEGGSGTLEVTATGQLALARRKKRTLQALEDAKHTDIEYALAEYEAVLSVWATRKESAEQRRVAAEALASLGSLRASLSAARRDAADNGAMDADAGERAFLMRMRTHIALSTSHLPQLSSTEQLHGRLAALTREVSTLRSASSRGGSSSAAAPALHTSRDCYNCINFGRPVTAATHNGFACCGSGAPCHPNTRCGLCKLNGHWAVDCSAPATTDAQRTDAKKQADDAWSRAKSSGRMAAKPQPGDP
jgi:hypothetical protein